MPALVPVKRTFSASLAPGSTPPCTRQTAGFGSVQPNPPLKPLGRAREEVSSAGCSLWEVAQRHNLCVRSTRESKQHSSKSQPQSQGCKCFDLSYSPQPCGTGPGPDSPDSTTGHAPLCHHTDLRKRCDAIASECSCAIRSLWILKRTKRGGIQLYM